jgi:hypothetical protein
MKLFMARAYAAPAFSLQFSSARGKLLNTSL